MHQIRTQTIRLERYCRRAKDKIWAAERDDLLAAMADVAEAGEIARRLYSHIQQYLAISTLHTTHALQRKVS
jgi:hypothetical protein